MSHSHANLLICELFSRKIHKIAPNYHYREKSIFFFANICLHTQFVFVMTKNYKVDWLNGEFHSIFLPLWPPTYIYSILDWSAQSPRSCLELCLYGLHKRDGVSNIMIQPSRAKPRLSSTNTSGPACSTHNINPNDYNSIFDSNFTLWLYIFIQYNTLITLVSRFLFIKYLSINS